MSGLPGGLTGRSSFVGEIRWPTDRPSRRERLARWAVRTEARLADPLVRLLRRRGHLAMTGFARRTIARGELVDEGALFRYSTGLPITASIPGETSPRG